MLRPETPIARQELHDTNDPREHARRLASFRARTAGHVWREQPNGEWWLVPVIDGASSSTRSPLPT